MFDLMGSICIVGASVCILWQRKKENRRKSETFMDLMQALRCLAEEIRLSRIPLPDLLENVAEGCGTDTARFFKQVSVVLYEGRNVVDAWRIAAKDLPLGETEQMVVSEISESLRSDEAGICKSMWAAIDSLATYKNSWDMQRREEERRISAMYVSGALLLVILLI